MQIGGNQSSNRMRMFGMGSGLDIDDMVKQLMDAERIPLNRVLQQRQLLQWKQEDYRAMRTKLKDLRTSAFNIGLTSAFNQAKISSNHEELVLATSSSGAPPGNYEVKVSQLADTVKLHSANIASGKFLKDQFAGIADTVTFEIVKKGATPDKDVVESFTFDTSTTTLGQVVDAINDKGMGIRAFYDATLGHVFISSTTTGSSSSYQFKDIAGDFLTSGLQLAYNDDSGTEKSLESGDILSGKDAIFDLNGVKDLRQSSNSFTINGVTFNLKQADPSTIVSVRVERDIDGVISNIKGFLDKYNEALTAINTELTEKRYYDFKPLTDEQKEEMTESEITKWEEKARSGALRADPVLREVVTYMRSASAGIIKVDGSPFASLYDIGIGTKGWSEGGELHILDETKLRNALNNNPDAVMKLFTQRGETPETKGVAQRLMESIDIATEKLTEHAGTVDMVVDDSYIGKRISDLDDRVAALEDRLIRREEYYYRQFSALESFMAQSNSTSSWLAQQFGG